MTETLRSKANTVAGIVSRLGLVVRRSAGKRKDVGSIPRFGSPFSAKIVIYGHCLVTLPCTIDDRLKSLAHLNAEIILVVAV